MKKRRMLDETKLHQQDSSRREEQAHRQETHLKRGGSELSRLHRHVGNQAVQRVLENRSQKEVDAATTRDRGLAARGAGDLTQVQRGGEQETIQRDEEEAAAEVDNGTVTIQEVQYDYYDVAGTTIAEVAAQLPATEWGHCHYHYDYNYDSENGSTTRVNVTLTLTVRLPRWEEGWSEASEAAKTEWNRMLAALGAHEEGHAAIARRWAPTIKERLLGLPEGDVEDRYNTVFAEAVAEQDQYDADTEHGQTEGVSLDASVDQEQPEEESEQPALRGGGFDFGIE